MTNTARRMAGLAMAILAVPAAARASATASDKSPHAHLRSDSPAIVALIARARDGSATFRRLVEGIDASDGTVYVQEGDCPDDAPACLIGVSMAGSRRNLWVRVSVKLHYGDWDLMGSIAHELRHTLEILAVPSITSTASMQMFYRREGFRGSSRGYETLAAIDAGNAVRSEVRASARRTKID
jgi:hypothetical protein